MADSGWTVWYWPGFKGRGEFARLMFEAAGVPYKEKNDGGAIVGRCDMRGSIGEGFPFPAKAPPVVTGPNGYNVSQSAVIMQSLGKKLGLYPDEVDEDHALTVTLTVMDFVAEGRLAFHAINPVGPYKEQAEETQSRVDWFKRERLVSWLSHFENILSKTADVGETYFFGGKLTYVDLAVFHGVCATEAQFSDIWEKVSAGIPLLVAHKKRIPSLPNIEAYLQSDRCRPWAGDSMM